MTLPTKPTEAIERIDATYCVAFGTNDAPMLDWVAVRFYIKELERRLDGEKVKL